MNDLLFFTGVTAISSASLSVISAIAATFVVKHLLGKK